MRGAGKGYRVIDAATFMLPGSFCSDNGKLFAVAVILARFGFGNADPAKLDGIRSLIRGDQDDRFAVDITDVIQAGQRGAKVFAGLLAEQCVLQELMLPIPSTTKTLLMVRPASAGKGSGSFPVATRLRLKVKEKVCGSAVQALVFLWLLLLQ